MSKHRLIKQEKKMKAVKAILITIVVAVVGFIIVVALVPDKACAGNNTWKTSEVCAKK